MQQAKEGAVLAYADPLIVQVIHRYHEDWEPPQSQGWGWVKCRCPFHGDVNPSASVSFEHNLFNCFTCGMKGDAEKIIMRMEGVKYPAAKRITAQMALGCDTTVQTKPAGKSGRRVPFESRPADAGSRPVRSGIRSRPSSWA